MTDPKHDKRVLKLIGLAMIATIIFVLREIQLEALTRNINGKVLMATAAGFGGCITGIIVIIRGWRKRRS